MIQDTIGAWHDLVRSSNPAGLDDILDEDVTFHSPVVFTPQKGKAITRMYLTAALTVLFQNDFKYVREIIGTRDAMLEFTTEIDGILINGIDIISWGDDGRITDFKVLLRPLKAVNIVHQKMAEMLDRAS
jgi:hypothetical protein